MKRRLFQQHKAELPSTKRRRLILKKERAINQGAQEALEGVSYQSEIGHSADVDVEKIPDPVPRPVFKPVDIQSGEPTFVTFDLETTDLIRNGQMPRITQIAAVETHSGEIFNTYVTPKKPISTEAQRVTGIEMTDNNIMKVRGNSVEHTPVEIALQKMCTWLGNFSNVILVAHSGRRFDFPVLTAALLCTDNIDIFFQCTLGLIDSLSVFSKSFPKQSHKQEDLARSLLGISYNAHNAVADVETLAHLLKFTKFSNEQLLSYSFPPKAAYHSLLFNREKSKNVGSLDLLVGNGIFKRPTAENIAGSGLHLSHLRTIFKRSGEDGLRDVFTVKNSEGLPRVTSAKKVLDEVLPKLAKYFSQ